MRSLTQVHSPCPQRFQCELADKGLCKGYARHWYLPSLLLSGWNFLFLFASCSLFFSPLSPCCLFLNCFIPFFPGFVAPFSKFLDVILVPPSLTTFLGNVFEELESSDNNKYYFNDSGSRSLLFTGLYLLHKIRPFFLPKFQKTFSKIFVWIHDTYLQRKEMYNKNDTT
jgi:hypothetical protein